MAEIYLTALTALLGGVLLHGIARPARLYEYPYFMCAAFAVFILPQAFSLYSYPGAASQRAIESVLIMTLLCTVACLVGYRARPSRAILELAVRPIDDQRLFHCGVLFIVAGFFFTVLISGMSAAEKGGTMWTGRVTIYLFFANLMFPGFAICFRQALRKGDAVAWFWTAAGAVIPAVSAVVYGRREPAVLFAVSLVMAFYFEKRWAPPRAAAVLLVIAAAIALPATGRFRTGIGRESAIERLTSIDFIGNFNAYISRASVLELRNAALLIEATSDIGQYDWGAAYWNQLVFRFVPAQILGKDFKDNLMLPTNMERCRQVCAARGYRAEPGSTITGMADAFQQFGYAGCLFFAVLAVAFKSLWHASLRENAVFAQLLYIQTSTSGMRAVTHQTVDYLPGLAYNLIFLGMAAIYARGHAQKAAPRRLARTAL